MKVGDKYIFRNKKGEEEKRTWIGSDLDWARYHSNNVFCPYSGFSLIDAGRIDGLWASLNTIEQKHVYYTLGIALPEHEFIFQPQHCGNIIISRPGSHGNALLELQKYLNSKMPDEAMDDYIHGLDPITGQYFPQY